MTQQYLFSERENQVVKLLLQGKSNKQIALALGVSQSTVEYHLKNVYKKLEVNSRTEAVLRLGKSIGDNITSELGKSIVEINDEPADNGGKPISLWRQKMNKKSITRLIMAIVGFAFLVSILLFITRFQPIEQSSTPVSLPTQVATFVSPNGIILYATSQNDFYIANADGSNPQLVMINADAPYDLSDIPHIVNAALSSNAKEIAYVSDGFIYLRNIQTGQQIKLNSERIGGEYTFMQWSSDGNQIGFDCYPATTSEICILDIQTGKIEILTNSKELGAIGMDGFYFGGWSQDGSRIGLCLEIAPEQSGRPKTSFYWLDVVTRKVNFVLDEKNMSGSWLGCPVLVPDGKQMIFDVFPADKSQHLYSINIDGGDLIEIVPQNAHEQNAYLSLPIIFNPNGESYIASYCSTQLYMGVCTPVFLSFDRKILYQLNLKDVIIKSWVIGSR
jgi:DNA-binding CsgD family transcriptional regulator